MVLPSVDEVTRVRSSSNGQKAAPAPAEWRGVSALSSLDHNVADLSSSPPAMKKPASPKAAPAAPVASSTAPVPVMLPSADIKKTSQEKKASPLQPLTSWGGVSSQVQDDHNFAAQASPEAPRPPVAAEPTLEEDQSEVPAVFSQHRAPAAARSRGASRDIEKSQLQPLTTYGGVASELGDEYNTPPSPQVRTRGAPGSGIESSPTPQHSSPPSVLEASPPHPHPRASVSFQVPTRRSRNASKEVKEEELKQTEVYPVPPPEDEVDQYAYDMANLKAAKAVESMGSKAGKNAIAVHKTPAPYAGLSSIVG